MENTSGLVPVDLRILVMPDAPKEKIGSIFVPEKAQDKAKFAGMAGTVIAAGRNAFTEWGEAAEKPTPGDRIIYAQYNGASYTGADGKDYLFLVHGDLLALERSAQ